MTKDFSPYGLRWIQNKKSFSDVITSSPYNFDSRAEVCIKKTKDDWYPNFNKKYVLLTYHSCINFYEKVNKLKTRRKGESKYKLNPEFTPCYRVSVWGSDDTGIIKDCLTKLEARQLFIQLRSLKYITKDLLIKDFKMEYF